MIEGNSDLKGLPQISASRIKVFRTCAKQYEFKYIIKPVDRPSEDRNVAALMGSALHKAIELKYRIGASPQQVFQERMLKTLEEWEAAGYKINGEQYLSKNLKEGRDILDMFQWDRLKPKELELYFSLPYPNKENAFARMTGFIDMVTHDEQVIDHKSQRKSLTQLEMAHDPQFLLYRWAYNELYNEYPAAVVWNELRSGELIDTGVEENYDDKIVQLTTDIHAMLNNTYYSRINLSLTTCKNNCSFYSLCWQGG